MAGEQHFSMTEMMAALRNVEFLARFERSDNDVLKKYYYSSDDELEYVPSVRQHLKVLRRLQREYNELKEEFLKEKAALEARYQAIYQPSYYKRYKIVNGIVEVEGVGMEDEAEEYMGKGIPNFWRTVMKNNEVVAGEIFEKDEEALKYLNDIKWSKLDNQKGFKLEFCFDTNPYFKNSVLTKFYLMLDEDPTLDKAVGTKIEWYPGKCLALNINQEVLTASKIKEPISFFDFFNPPAAPASRSDIDDATAEMLQTREEHDYYVGRIIRDKIIPHAVSWFTGEARDDAYNPGEKSDESDDA